MSDMDDVVSEFLVESYENLDRLDSDLVSLEENPNERPKLASIFRTIHTIKGTCGFLGFGKLERVAHVGENLLSKLRDGELALDAEITSGLLGLVDAVRKMLGSIEKNGNEGDAEFGELVILLTRLAGGQSTPASAGAAAAPAAAVDRPTLAAKPEPSADESSPSPQSSAEQGQEEVLRLGEQLVRLGAIGKDNLESALEAQRAGDPSRIGQILLEQGALSQRELNQAIAKTDKPAIADSSIRVDVGLLDKLMNLVGELVLARNQVLQFNAVQRDNSFAATSQRINLITTELQESVMKTRMQPIGNIWNKFPRVVRDLAMHCSKEVRIEMEGRETELDKTIIEAIKDPLTHIVRNSIDHGIESPDERVRRGKAREGVLLLRAFHEGGQVNIEITDDGGGVDYDRVKKKAVEKGLITPDQAARMTEREAINLIFLPGFSTAQVVSNVSGRGVGMDVVKTNIEKIGGQVDVQSRTGQGMTIRIKIPLTLAIIPALLVTTHGQRYAIPQVNLLELVRLENDQDGPGIESIHGAQVYRLRGRLLPLIHLERELSLTDKSSTANSARNDNVVNIVVLQADDRQFGLVVESINDTEEIVVKPLGKQLKGLSMFAGATIMGDGRVALILDVLGLAQHSNVLSQVGDRTPAGAASVENAKQDDRQSLLIFTLGQNSRMAMPLSMVARLEEFPIEQIERAADRDVVQYRDQILPLVRLTDFFEKDSSASQSVVQVVVFTHEDRSIGLIVDRILDIVDEQVTVQQRSKGRGLLGSAVVQGKVTDLLDARSVIAETHPSFFEELVTA